MLRPSRAFLFFGALLCAALPFADRLVEVGPGVFLKSLPNDARIWTIAGRLFFFVVLGATVWIPSTRAGAGWIVTAVALYGVATVGCFLSVFSARDPLFDAPIRGPSTFLLLLPLAGGFHLSSLVMRDFPWWLVGFWARVELAALIVLCGAVHAMSALDYGGWDETLGAWLAVAAGVFLIAGEILARREDAFAEAGHETDRLIRD